MKQTITNIKEPAQLREYEGRTINPDTCCIECKRYGTTPSNFPNYCGHTNCKCHK